MYILIVGAGEVGSYLARILVEENHDVAVIETNEGLARRVEVELDALVIHGSGVSHQVLRRAGVRKADLVIAVTEVDEVNLIACMTASRLGKDGVRTVARVRQSAYLTGTGSLSAAELGLDLLVGPEQAVAERVVHLLRFEGAGEIRYLADGRIVLLELPMSPDSPLVHETLAELAESFPKPSLVAGVYGAHGLRMPHGGTRMHADERADILTTPDNVDEFLILSGKPWHHVRHALIIGCGTIGFRCAQMLESQRLYPTIIEIDEARAKYVAKRLPRSLVLLGDGTDPGLLREQLEEVSDAVVVLLDDDKAAILTAALCKHLGAKKVIVRGDSLEYKPIAHKLDIDAMLSPQRAVANAILRFVRRGDVQSRAMLGDHEGEIVEITMPESPHNRELYEKPLRDLELPSGALIGVVIRGDEVSIAGGETVLAPGDRVMVITMVESIGAVGEVFRARD
jgi:trk system potassium uptake protein TrkA